MREAFFTVRKIRHPNGRQSWWIFTADGELHRPSLDLLKRYGPSTQQTYAYNLVDHLIWTAMHRKTPDTVTVEDLVRYMNGITGTDGVYGNAYWRAGRAAISPTTAYNVATVLKA